MIKKILLVLCAVSLLVGVGMPSWAQGPRIIVGDILPDGIVRQGDTLYYLVDQMNFERTRDMFLGLRKFEWKKLQIDLLSGGGRLFDAMGMISLFKEQQSYGKIIEIRGRGIIASAGLLILIAGSPGHRFLDKYAVLMFHELYSMKLFAIETPTDKEEEAKVYRKIQDNVNTFITEHSKISREELAEKIRKKEFWMDAKEAVKYGFADGIWGEEAKK